MCEGKRIKKRKTSVKKSTLNPVYNEAMVFDVPRESVDDIYMVIKVIDYDRYVTIRTDTQHSKRYSSQLSFYLAFSKQLYTQYLKAVVDKTQILSSTKIKKKIKNVFKYNK